jgi:hypothetical protein
MRRAFRLVIEFFPTVGTNGSRLRQRHALAGPHRRRRRAAAVLAVAALTALGSPHTASGAESSRGLHVVSTGAPDEGLVLASDGTPWFTASHAVVHVTADGRVVRYPLPANGEWDFAPAAWGADGALWEVDDAINGLIRVAPDGRSTRFRDVWATPKTRDKFDVPLTMIAGPDGRLWLDYQHRILSVAADGPARVVATLGARVDPQLWATGPDGSVWFTPEVSLEDAGLQRVLPDGHVEAVRYPNSEIDSASVASNGDVWFTRSMDRGTNVERTDLVRIDRAGRGTEFRGPRLRPESIAAATDGTVWIAGGDANNLRDEVLARMDRTGHFQRIYRSPGWEWSIDMRAAPDGRLWLVIENDASSWKAWLPPNPCLSRRRISLHLHSRRGNPIRSVRLSVQGRLPHTFHGRHPSIPIDLRGYLPGAVGVTLKIRTAHRRYVRHRVYHTCTSSS